jgi:hypothetical protein
MNIKKLIRSYRYRVQWGGNAAGIPSWEQGCYVLAKCSLRQAGAFPKCDTILREGINFTRATGRKPAPTTKKPKRCSRWWGMRRTRNRRRRRCGAGLLRSPLALKGRGHISPGCNPGKHGHRQVCALTERLSETLFQSVHREQPSIPRVSPWAMMNRAVGAPERNSPALERGKVTA